MAEKKAKPRYFPCDGGPSKQFRIEAGVEPPHTIPLSDGEYQLEGSRYKWVQR